MPSQVTSGSAPNSPTSTDAVRGEARGVKGLGQKVCRYFLDFLETDFKKQQAPRRRIMGRTDSGQPTSVNLRKYRTLYAEVWRGLNKPLSQFPGIKVTRRAYQAQLSPILQDLIRKHVAAIEPRLFDEAVAAGIDEAKRGRVHAPRDIEKYVETVLDAIGSSIDKKIVAPLLAILDEPVKTQAYSPIDSIYEIESDLIDALVMRVDEQLSGALTTYVIDGGEEPLSAMLRECLDAAESKTRLSEYLESLATADIYQELRELHDFLRTQEQAAVYLYVCDFRVGSNQFPLIYFPLQMEFDKENGEFRFALDPHLYVNKRALDFVLLELADKLGKLLLSPIEERILYLDEARPLIDEIERVVNRVQSVLNLDAIVDVRAGTLQSATSSTIRLTTSLHLAVFDKSDESLLNDYEALLATIHSPESGVGSLFEKFVESCILEEPIRVVRAVDDNWDATAIPVRLVPESPIPLNEEQRKLLVALQDPKCRHVVVYGPPGSGKSHTITAIAFDCILKARNILVLSDKQEALDVVEDKLTQTLQKIRHSDDFQNPILRLGRSGGTYTRLLANATLEKIRLHHRAARQNASKLQSEIAVRDSALKGNIQKTVDLLSSIQLTEIEELHRLEAELETKLPGLTKYLQRTEVAESARRLQTAAGEALAHPALGATEILFEAEFRGTTLSDLVVLLKLRTALHHLADLRNIQSSLILFRGLDQSHGRSLELLIGEYEALKMPLFGFLFRRQKLADLNGRFLEALPCVVEVDLHKRLKDFRAVRSALDRLDKAIKAVALPVAAGKLCYEELRDGNVQGIDLTAMIRPLNEALALQALVSGFGCTQNLEPRRLGGNRALLEYLAKMGRFADLWHKTRATLDAVPVFDAVASRTTLHELYTQKMADQIDGRFIDFVDRAHTTAKSLVGVIRGKKQFPTETFAHLRDAFPCTIAGIREFAEYIPLRENLFDVVVIDEASQVSVAQAFPALLRAKQVVVFGDPKQFSNVKSANASNALNHVYLNDIRAYFQDQVSKSADKLQRLSQFDVKRSILEFIELVANFSITLKKHFRGYQELISFSSRYFYGNDLQAIKVRGKPLDEVILFSELPEAEVASPRTYKNVNEAECKYILATLDQLLEEEIPPSVGVITPFREQQQYLTRELYKSGNAAAFDDRLKLKIMTFDTCQGEERDLIIYSMVATAEHDVLNYIFPVDLKDSEDRVDEKLKMQRLNVGFSRAKEAIHFVLSKPVDKFAGSIGRVLQHYRAVLERDTPSDDEVDPNSPMEKSVLDWLLKAPFYQRHASQIEIRPQFPVGDYLKQLDPFYVHPRYRVDFLLGYRTAEGRTFNIVIEYDGFQEHFIEHGKVNIGNYDWYYRPQDVERQMILESYGYKFLRINRFNLGTDPVATLSERLYALVEAAQVEERSGVLDSIATQIEGQEDGSLKVCSRCNGLKKIEDFFDQGLRSGVGAYGRVCMACKRSAKEEKSGKSRASGGLKRWKSRHRWR